MLAKNGQQASELGIALATLEDVLETPVVPGELTEWCQRAWVAFEEVQSLYACQARPSHARQVAEIRRQDQEMSTIVTQLTQEDKAIAVEIKRLGALLHAHAEDVDPKAEGSEEAMCDSELSREEERRTLVRELLALVIRIRTQEKALATWFVEAFQRDRGVAD